MKVCPLCREAIHDQAIVCSHCGRSLALYQPVSKGLIVFLAIFGLVMLLGFMHQLGIY